MNQDEDAHDVQRFDGNRGKFSTHIVADFVQPVLSQMEGFSNFHLLRAGY